MQRDADNILAPDDSWFRLLAINLGVAVVATDLEQHIVFWNAAAARMFGAAGDQMRGAKVGSIVPHERRAIAEDMVARAITTGETVQFDFESPDEHGERRELAATAAPIVSEGRRVGASLCVRDITNRIRLQSELSDARKMGALGELAGAVAHHFNNILGGAITSIDYAAAKSDPVTDRKVLKQIGSSLARATTLVGDLLLFAEGRRRSQDVCDLTELLGHISDEAEELIADRHIRFEYSAYGLPVTAVARVELETILRNMIRNAVDAMPQGGALSLTARLLGGVAIIQVSDTGVGMSEDARSRVFEPFWTGKSLTFAGPGQGAGLGMAIAHGLARSIGATIDVESSPGKGALFTIRLPIEQTNTGTSSH